MLRMLDYVTDAPVGPGSEPARRQAGKRGSSEQTAARAPNRWGRAPNIPPPSCEQIAAGSVQTASRPGQAQPTHADVNATPQADPVGHERALIRAP